MVCCTPEPSDCPGSARAGPMTSPEESGELLAVAEAVLLSSIALRNEAGHTGARRAVREAGPRPSPQEDPLNAIVRRCRRARAKDTRILLRATSPAEGLVAIASIPLTWLGHSAGFIAKFTRDRDRRITCVGGGIDMHICSAGQPRDSSGAAAVSGEATYGVRPNDRRRLIRRRGGGAPGADQPQREAADPGQLDPRTRRVVQLIRLKQTHYWIPDTSIAGIDHALNHRGLARQPPPHCSATSQVRPGDPRRARGRRRPTASGRSTRASGDLRGTPASRRRPRRASPSVGAEARDPCAAVRVACRDRLGDLARAYGAGGVGSTGTSRRAASRSPASIDGADGADERAAATASAGRTATGKRSRAGDRRGRAAERADELSAAGQAVLAAGGVHLRDRLGLARRTRSRAATRLRPWLPGAAYDRALGDADVTAVPEPRRSAFRPGRRAAHERRRVTAAAGRTLAQAPYPADMSGQPRSRSPWPRRTAAPVGGSDAESGMAKAATTPACSAIAATMQSDALGWAPAERAPDAQAATAAKPVPPSRSASKEEAAR